MHTISLVLSRGYQNVCEGLQINENECNYGLTYLNFEHFNGFHGNPASLFYEVDTCSQILCRFPTVIIKKIIKLVSDEERH